MTRCSRQGLMDSSASAISTYGILAKPMRASVEYGIKGKGSQWGSNPDPLAVSKGIIYKLEHELLF